MSDNHVKKIMLDTQIYDLIANTSNMAAHLNDLSERGTILILSTHIQEDEISNIPDKEKKAIIDTVVRKIIPTSGNIIGISKVGKSTYGDGSSGGFGIDEFRSRYKNHSKDALIATTAAKHADVLVVRDRRFKNRMQTLVSRCEVWTFDKFKEYIFNSIR